LLTNSLKPGPKEAHAGNIYGFAHQAYWGFRFLAERRKTFWKQILKAKTARSIQEVGRACSQSGAMTKAGYGAAGLMTWLTERRVAVQVLKAKQHRHYPDSERPSSEDRRMIFLGIAVAAGIWGIEYSTALRKLAEAGLGLEYLAQRVHAFDNLKVNMRQRSLVFAEPVENYFYRLPNGKWQLIRELPCDVPVDFQGGFIMYGYTASGPQSTFSPTLPLELVDSGSQLQKGPQLAETMASSPPSGKRCAPNSVKCRCGAKISAQTRKLAIQALAEHKRIVHGTRR